jgi:hypothetical protein
MKPCGFSPFSAEIVEITGAYKNDIFGNLEMKPNSWNLFGLHYGDYRSKLVHFEFLKK